MEKKLRKSGINIIGDVPWGTHFCQFYQTKEDLIDILVPYFKVGLENNEFCMWITSEPLNSEEAKEALRKAVPNFDFYLEIGQIEIIPYTYWYVKEGIFDSQRVLNGWVEKLNEALANGYQGLRLSGNTFWLEKKDWNNFVDYEEEIDRIIGNYEMIALCTYCLDKCNTTEIIDVVINHQFALIKKEGKWEQIESSKRKKAEEAAIQATKHWEYTFDAMPDLIAILDADYKIIRANSAMAAKLGMAREACTGLTCYRAVHGSSEPPSFCPHTQLLRDGLEHTAEVCEDCLGGYFLVSVSPLCDSEGKAIGSVHVARDINARKKAEEALIRREDEFRTLAENSPDVIARFDRQNRHIYVNPAAALPYGYSQEEIIGKTHTELGMDLEKLKFWEAHHEKVFTSGKPETMEFQYTAPQGKEYYFNTRIVPEFVAGEVSSILAISRDITDIKEAETRLKETLDNLGNLVKERTKQLASAYKLLKENEKGLAEAQRMVHLGNWDWDLTTGKMYWSDEIYRIFGCSSQKFSATYDTFLSFVHPDDQAHVDDAIQRALKEESYNIDFRIIQANGEECIVHEQGEVIYDRENVPVQMRGTIQDITERKRVEKELELANIYNRSLIEASVDPLVTIGPDGKITDVNNSTEFATGYSREELIGTDFSDYFTEPEKARKGYQYVFQEGLVRDYPLEIQHKNGQITPVLYNASVYTDENGKVIGVFAAARDITELKKVQKELELASKYNRSLIEASLDPLVTIGPDGKITDVNISTEFVTGCSREELIGTDFSNYFTDPEKAKEGYKQVFREGLVRDYALEIQHKEGHITPVLYNASIYRDEESNIVGIFAAARDITERKKAEEKIQSLANVVESSNDAIITKSLDGIILSWNKGAEQIYGYSPEEILGKPVSTLATFPLNEETLQLIEKIKQGKNIRHYETSRLRKDGKIIDVSITLSPVFNLSGKLNAVSVIARDITESKKAGREIKENEERYRIVTEQTGHLIYEYDIGKNKIYWTGSIEKITGYAPDELINKGMEFWVDNVHPEDRNKVWDEKIKDCSQGIHYIGDKKNFHLEYRFRRKDGSYIYIEDHGVCLQKGSYLTNKVLGVMKDITERKEAEALLAKIEEARKKEIHHRIKNNLQVISSLLDLQAEKFDNYTTYDTSKVLEAFKESKNRVISMALIHEELYGSREVSTLDFGAYLKKLTKDLFKCYNFGDLKAHLILEIEEKTFFNMDTAVPLGIIVNELVSNSLKHAFPGRDKGKIQIKLCKEESRDFENKRIGNKNTSFVLTVSDNGIGIPETVDLEDSDTLGIQLVTILVDQLDGKFQLKRNSGTEFIINFSIPEQR